MSWRGSRRRERESVSRRRRTRMSMRRLGSGNAGGGAAVAGEWDGGGIAGRMRGVNAGIMDEKVLELVFRALNWDPRELCVVARVSRRLRAVAERVLWRELCVSRAPRMVSALSGPTAAVAAAAGASGRLAGDGEAALLLLRRGGRRRAGPLRARVAVLQDVGPELPVAAVRGDLLFVSDPCEHAAGAASDDDVVGAYRGVYRGFMRSRTRAFLVGHRARWSRASAAPTAAPACEHDRRGARAAQRVPPARRQRGPPRVLRLRQRPPPRQLLARPPLLLLLLQRRRDIRRRRREPPTSSSRPRASPAPQRQARHVKQYR